MSLRGGGEHELQAFSENVTQDKTHEHLGVAPRVPDPVRPSGHPDHGPQRDMGDVSRQPRAGRRDSDRFGLHRQQSHDRGRDTRQASLEIRRDHFDLVGRQGDPRHQALAGCQSPAGLGGFQIVQG